MNGNSNNELYERLNNEAKGKVNTGVFKSGANLILWLGILSLVLNVVTALLIYDSVSPVGWLIFLLFPVTLIICSIFARKGHTWAFIVPLVIYVIDTAMLISSLNWWQIVLRVSLLVFLGKTINDVLVQKRIAKQEALRQISQ